MKAKGLGRGLDALLGGDEAPRETLLTLPVGRIRPGRYQPRTRMDQQALAELAESIRTQGLMQPLLVRPVDRERYELIAGERRWRAAQMAGLEEVPALVREALDAARQIEAGNRVAAKGLSARDTEALVQSMLRGASARRKKKTDRDLARLEEELAQRLGTTVEIRAGKKGSGKLLLHYASLDHLDALLKKLR